MFLSPRVSALIDSMSLQEKVGQIFIFTWINEQQAINDLRLYPGGYIRIYSDAFTVARQSAMIQRLARLPLIIAADLERGIGGTITGPLETVTCMALGATGSEQAAYDSAHMIGSEAAALGINMNYAPCLDVNSNPANPVINTRSFGGDPHLVARLGVAFARGLQDAGVASCGKHFPGHGDSAIDSHSDLGTVDGNRDRLDAIELVPFKAAIAADIDSIMSAHLVLPAIDPDFPATLSRAVMTDLLRTELGFRGLAVSDALDMGAVAENFPPTVAIPMAINAGCDQLIMPQDNEAAVNILLSAVQTGVVSEDRLNEAVARTLTLKEKRGILDTPPVDASAPLSVYIPHHIERAHEIAADSITLISNNDTLPLQQNQRIFCLSFHNGADSRSTFLEPRSFADYLAADNWTVTKADIGKVDEAMLPLNNKIVEKASNSDIIIFAAYVNVRLSSGTVALPPSAVNHLHELHHIVQKPIILVSFGSPYLGSQFPWASAFACAYGATQPSQHAMAQAIKGKAPFNGRLPVTL